VSPTRKKENLKGIVVSVPTAVNRKYQLDLKKMKEHVAWLVDQGIRTGKGVIMLAGGSGEGYFIPFEEHKKIMEALVDAANGKVPTMTGIFEVSTAESVKKAKYASDVGIDYIQYNPPHYEKPTDDEVFTHYEMVSNAADVGIVAYNSPWSTMGYEITARLIERLIKLEHVWGFKWFSYEPGSYVECLEHFSDKANFLVNTGPFSQFRALAYLLGAKGFVSEMANFNPKGELLLLDLLERKEYSKYIQEDRRLRSFEREIAAATDINKGGLGEGTMSKGKLAAAGKDFGPPYKPQTEMSSVDIEKMRRIMKKSGVI
jgi:4-hydroxy-tetrahydrodipicolinate synthase